MEEFWTEVNDAFNVESKEDQDLPAPAEILGIYNNYTSYDGEYGDYSDFSEYSESTEFQSKEDDSTEYANEYNTGNIKIIIKSISGI